MATVLTDIRDAIHPITGDPDDFDETRAVEPLERTALWEGGELPEPWPTAL